MSEANEAYPSANGYAPEYVIATVGDFLKVPEDRQADCLAEFADFLGIARGIVELASIAGEVVGVDAAAQIGPFTWIDDGKKNRRILFQRITTDITGVARGHDDEVHGLRATDCADCADWKAVGA